MKKPINEPDFIGGQGALTKEEDLALSLYFAKKKAKEPKKAKQTLVKVKSSQIVSA